MICFRDMTFCESKTCVTPWCPRRLTPDVWVEAKKWWGSADAPVAVSDYSATCSDYKKAGDVETS